MDMSLGMILVTDRIWVNVVTFSLLFTYYNINHLTETENTLNAVWSALGRSKKLHLSLDYVLLK